MKQDVAIKVSHFFTDFACLTYKQKQILFRSDQKLTSVYFIQSGFIRIFRISENGEELTLLILKPGDFYPMTYGLNHMPNIYYLEALTPVTVWKAPQEQFLHFISESPEVFFELSTSIMDKFDGLLSRMEYLVWSSAYTKIAATLFICAKQFGEVSGSDILLQIPLTHREIATLVGLTRETTSLEMKKLEKKGLIGRKNKRLVIHNMERLEQESLLNNHADLLVNNFL